MKQAETWEDFLAGAGVVLFLGSTIIKYNLEHNPELLYPVLHFLIFMCTWDLYTFIPTKEFAAAEIKQASCSALDVVIIECCFGMDGAASYKGENVLPLGKDVLIFQLHPSFSSLVDSVKRTCWKGKMKKSLWEIRHFQNVKWSGGAVTYLLSHTW